MNTIRASLPRLALILFLLIAPSAFAAAPAPTPHGAQAPRLVAWFDWVPVETSNVTRSTVVRVAALGMVLALFIMYRNKY